ncbi:MAG: rRNA synthase [Solirubrobacteraceae bacterium]|nr:rRNA synthase [Solirubrobacteraceae bacterium]
MPERELRVGAEHDGERLDIYLAEIAGSRSAAQKLIEAGVVTVDGRGRTKRFAVRRGQRVMVGSLDELPEPEAPPATFEVAFEDDDVLVIDKPPGVVVHPAPAHRTGTLVQALEGRVAGGPDPERPGVVHRLDRDTSGLLVLARSERAHAALSAAMGAREIVREYLALVDGRPAARSGTIDAPLGRDRRVRTRISIDTDDAREAITHFEAERNLERSTLLRVRLQTGRTHQIRAHMLAIGHPVLGDPEYGRPGYGLKRQFLHAARLAFAHPVSGTAVELRSPLPDDLEAALALAEAE